MYLFILIWLIWPSITNQSNDDNRVILQEITLPKNLNEKLLKLNCDLIQGEQVEFIWLFNNEKLIENSKRKIKSNDESSQLIIRSLTVDDIGTYSCLAKSTKFGSDRKDVNVFFNGSFFYQYPEIIYDLL